MQQTDVFVFVYQFLVVIVLVYHDAVTYFVIKFPVLIQPFDSYAYFNKGTGGNLILQSNFW